jgi:hypothetical protein
MKSATGDPQQADGKVCLMRLRFEKLLSYAAMLAVLAAAPTAMAGTITGWTFETSAPATAGPHAAEIGTGSATGVHAGAATFSTPAGNGSARSFSSNVWAIGDYYQFTTSSATFSNIGISWEETRSGTGPSAFEVQYSTDGSTYTALPALLVPAYTVAAVTWNSGTPDATGNSNFVRDLSSITGLNNNATIGFRLVATGAAGGTAGTNRVDNFRVLDNVPEPCTAMLLGMAGFALVACSRRSIR